jgi:spore maturation protein CgeB
MYKLQDIEKLPCKIQYYMDNEIEAQNIAEAGRMLAQQKHTWSNRAEELMKIMKVREM